MGKRIALIGCGIWGQNILRELVHLKAITDVFETDSQIEKHIIKLGADRLLSGLPSPEQYDGIIIATPSSMHRTTLEQFTSSEIPIFLEKPMTINLEDALALEASNHENVYMMHIWLYHPGIRLLGDIGRSGELGKVLGVKSVRANWTSPRQDTDTAWNLLPHDITIAKEILGFIPKPKAATAELHNGVIRGLTALLGSDPYCTFEVSNRYERKIREVRVHCEKGVAVLSDEKTDHIKIIHGNADSDSDKIKIEKRAFEKTPPLRLEIKEFLDYLEGGSAPGSNFAHGVEVVKTIHELIELSEK